MIETWSFEGQTSMAAVVAYIEFAAYSFVVSLPDFVGTFVVDKLVVEASLVSLPVVVVKLVVGELAVVEELFVVGQLAVEELAAAVEQPAVAVDEFVVVELVSVPKFVVDLVDVKAGLKQIKISLKLIHMLQKQITPVTFLALLIFTIDKRLFKKCENCLLDFAEN